MALITNEQKDRYRRFWDREETDRACMFLTSWDGAPGFGEPADAEQRWGDLDWRESKELYENEHTRYHAEGFPTVWANFGPGSLAACIGGTYKFAPSTVWFENEPFFAADFGTADPALNPDSAMYRMIEEYTVRLLNHGDRFYTGISDIGGTFDVVAALHGTSNLLYDMYDDPEGIKAFAAKVQPLWKAYYQAYSSRLLKAQGAMTSWQPVWSDKTYYPLQCDYCAMLSPKMFDEFILPDLAYQTSYMDRSIYHLDGPGELPHVDSLLSLPRLNAIQWTSGDGNPVLTDPCWFDLYRRILGAGKGLILLGLPLAEAEPLFKAVGQRGMFLTSSVRDAQEAEEFCKMAQSLQKEFHK